MQYAWHVACIASSTRRAGDAAIPDALDPLDASDAPRARRAPPSDAFRRFAAWSAERVGSSLAFDSAVVLVVAWAASGPLFDYSDGWELVINTVTTILTFLMVFLIQNAQNRDAKVTQLKLDELLRSVAEARTGLVGLEHLDDEALDELERQFDALRARRCPRPPDRDVARGGDRG